MSYDCEKCGGDLTGLGGPLCSCNEVNRKHQLLLNRQVNLDLEQENHKLKAKLEKYAVELEDIVKPELWLNFEDCAGNSYEGWEGDTPITEVLTALLEGLSD